MEEEGACTPIYHPGACTSRMLKPSEHLKTPSNRIAFAAFSSLFLLTVSASPMQAPKKRNENV